MQRSLIQAVAPTDFTTVRDPQRSALERKACMPPAPTAIGTDDGYLVPNPEFFENTDGPNASPASTARLSLSRPSPQEIPTCGPRSDGASTLGWAREISELDSTPYATGRRRKSWNGSNLGGNIASGSFSIEFDWSQFSNRIRMTGRSASRKSGISDVLDMFSDLT